jgi:hypothetical protein
MKWVLGLLLFLVACAGPRWIDVPSAVVDLQAVRHNEHVCREQGKAFNVERWRCE